MTTSDDLNILNTSGEETAKVEALHRVAVSDDPRVLQVLLAMAEDTSLVAAVGKAVGAAIARIYWRQRRVYDAPLHLFTGPAGEGFDDAVSSFQLAAPNNPGG